jgi:hypothetical protein
MPRASTPITEDYLIICWTCGAMAHFTHCCIYVPSIGTFLLVRLGCGFWDGGDVLGGFVHAAAGFCDFGEGCGEGRFGGVVVFGVFGVRVCQAEVLWS